MFQRNYPETKMIVGDIREKIDDIVTASRMRLAGRNLDILFATPPCQGMSKNGRGKLLRGVRDGLKDELDPRNQLATFVPEIVNQLNPSLVVFENVPEMESTLVEDINKELVNLLDYLQDLMPDYVGVWKTIEFADYGVPQRRKRLITVFVRRDILSNNSKLVYNLSLVFPPQTHSNKPGLIYRPRLSVNEPTGFLPTLDAKNETTARSEIPYHYVSVLEARKYWWVSNTKPNKSAFDNQCVNAECMFDENQAHGTGRNSSGVNSANTTTPIYCSRCESLLPRPVVGVAGEERLMKGFTSAYKRMSGDLPASALTTNLSYVMSDQKVHPSQHRPLSLYEAMVLHTITDFKWIWELSDGKKASDKLIRESIGESIPPRGLQIIFSSIFEQALNCEKSLNSDATRAG